MSTSHRKGGDHETGNARATLGSLAGIAALATGLALLPGGPPPDRRPPANDLIVDLALRGALVEHLVDQKPRRDTRLKTRNKVVTGEGIYWPSPGTVVYDTDAGKHLQQELRSVVVDGEAALPRRAGRAQASQGDDVSHVSYRDVVEGVDVDYTWDGRRVSEHFLLQKPLQDRLAREHKDITVTSVFRGVTRKTSVMVPRGTYDMVNAQGELNTKAAVDLYVDGDRYRLPPALALDDSGSRATLRRSFSYGDDGLVVATTLPARVVGDAQGQMIIDPDFIEDSFDVDIGDADRQVLVKDGAGTYHAVYVVLNDNGEKVVHSTSSDGENWTRSATIEEEGVDAITGETKIAFFAPTLAIDASGNLAAAYIVMYGATDPVPMRTKSAHCRGTCPTGGAGWDAPWLHRNDVPETIPLVMMEPAIANDPNGG